MHVVVMNTKMSLKIHPTVLQPRHFHRFLLQCLMVNNKKIIFISRINKYDIEGKFTLKGNINCLTFHHGE